MTYEINETTYSEGEHQQMHNLIIKYAEANLREYRGHGSNKYYWRGVKDTYQAVLNTTYGNDWAVHGSIGYYVFVLSQDYITAKESAKAFQLQSA
jgi:hypothetical protein